MQDRNPPSGVTAEKERNMQTLTQNDLTSRAPTAAGILPFVAAAVIGLGLMATVGHVQAATLHDAAHDVRHATGFPCH